MQTRGDTVKIAGLQKMTLLDYPGKVAATVFLGGCNFRCPYCHNASLVTLTARTPEMPEEEFFGFLRKRKVLLDGVCISGGEPLLQEGLGLFLDKIKALGFLTKLDTNGSFPARLKALVQGGLVDTVAMDVKNSPAKYAVTAGTSKDVLADVQETISYLLGRPVAYEFRTTAVRSLHAAEDFIEIGKWIRGAERYFLQNFADSADVLAPGLQGFEPAELEAFAEAVRPFVPSVMVRGQ
jgi:pyruvate formate lyase activating enzyme